MLRKIKLPATEEDKRTKPVRKVGHKPDPKSETLKYVFKIGVGNDARMTSITLRKNIIALWILMMQLEGKDSFRVVQEFIEKVCLKRWERKDGKGLSDFVTKCMIHSFLDRDDFLTFRRIYLSL